MSKKRTVATPAPAVASPEPASVTTDPNWPRDLKARLNRLGKAGLEVTVELGRTRLALEQIVNLEPGSLVELEKMSNHPVDIRVNGTLFGKGEILVIGDNLAVRMTELLKPEKMK